MTTAHPKRPEPGGTAAREARARSEARPRVTLLRHGEPDWSPKGGLSVNDPGLTPFGHAQAEAAAEVLAQRGVDALYVSPYQRSQETAAPLAEATGLTPVTLENLKEIGVAASGLTQEAVDAYFVEATRRPLEEHWEGWPGAETFHEFHARVTAVLADILSRHGITSKRAADFKIWQAGDEAPHVVVVAHGGTNAVALSHLLDIRPVPWEWLRLESELSAYSTVLARPLGPEGLVWSLQAFGCVDHLERHGLLS